MIKHMNALIAEWFSYIVIESVDLLMPGWLDCIIDHWFDGAVVDEAPEQITLTEPGLDEYAEEAIITRLAVKNNKLTYDFNLN